MVAVSFDQAVVLVRTPFTPRLRSYLFSNDGAAAITVFLDDRRFIVGSGESLVSVAGESLGALAVATSGVAWRFLGA